MVPCRLNASLFSARGSAQSCIEIHGIAASSTKVFGNLFCADVFAAPPGDAVLRWVHQRFPTYSAGVCEQVQVVKLCRIGQLVSCYSKIYLQFAHGLTCGVQCLQLILLILSSIFGRAAGRADWGLNRRLPD